MQHVKLELTENFGVTVSKVRNFNHSIASFSIFDVKDAGILLKIKGIYIISNDLVQLIRDLINPASI